MGELMTALVLIGMYFVPAFVALGRRHRNFLAIAILNIVGGWVLIGWIVAMVWACTDNVKGAKNA